MTNTRPIVNTLVLVFLFAFPLMASAQTSGGPTSRLGWDQAAPSLAAAQGFVYEAFFDGTQTVTTLTATCTGTASPFSCVAPFPALSTGAHSTQIRAVDTVSVVGQRLVSPLSTTFNFTLVALPGAPTNVRIVP
jgi:hypothetical protein